MPNDPNSVTKNPCAHHTGDCALNGSCGCNSFAGGAQCFAFALYMAYLVFGSYPIYTTSTSPNGGDCGNGWKKYNSGYISSITLEPGDIIRCSGHSAIVWYTNGGEFQVGEVWGDPPNATDNCRINWGNFNGNSSNKSIANILNRADYIIKAPKTYATVKNAGSGRYLSVLNGAVSDGNRIVQLSYNGEDNQMWDVSKYDLKTVLNSNYGIKYVYSDGTYCRIYNTYNDDTSLTIVSSGSYYKIKTVINGITYCLAADASGGNVYWATEDSSAYQKWIFT